MDHGKSRVVRLDSDAHVKLMDHGKSRVVRLDSDAHVKLMDPEPLLFRGYRHCEILNRRDIVNFRVYESSF